MDRVKVSERQFRKTLRSKLGTSWDRALFIFRNCGPNLAYDVSNVLIEAVAEGRVEQVLDILEEHYRNHLRYQDPKIRGIVGEGFGINPTQTMFLRIYRKTLGFRSDPV